MCQWITREVRDAISGRQNVLVNMHEVLRVDPDGLGCLMEARRLLHAQGLTLWLTELSPAVLRVLEYSALKGLFLIAETTREAARMSTLGIPETSGNIRLIRGHNPDSRPRANVA